MKKFISILMALGMSLMLTAIVSAAEAPEIRIATEAIPAEQIGEYGEVPGYDAYLLNVYFSGVDLNRTNSNTVSGRLMAAFELTFKSPGSQDVIDWENSYMWESDAGAEIVKGTDAFQIKSGEPSRAASFPAKNVTITADEEVLFASALVYIPTGTTLDFNVYELSMVFSTYSAGSISDSSLTKVYDIANPESTVVCTERNFTFGSKGSTPATTDSYFAANVVLKDMPKAADTLVYLLKTNEAGKEDKTGRVELPLGTVIEGAAGTVIKTALKITDIPADVTVTCTGVEWK